jgi:hypothetical protein
MLLDYRGWRSLYKSVVLQFPFNGSRFFVNPGDLRLQSLPLPCLVSGSDGEENLAERGNCDWSASRRLVFGVERYFLGI